MPITPQAGAHLSVSIVTHDSSAALLAEVLDSLYRAAARARGQAVLARLSLVVVDNASSAAHRGELAARLEQWPAGAWAQTVFLPQLRNRGFGAGHNIALAEVDSDYHLILNPDAELASDVLARGIPLLADDASIALLSPRVSAPGGGQEFLCKRYPSLLVLLLRGFAPAWLRRPFARRLEHYEMRAECGGDEPCDVVIASGCFMLARTAALRAVGAFDERFFLYFEDFDLSLRLRAQGRLVFHPTLHIVHHGGYAARKGRRHIVYFLRSALTFFRQHGWRWL